MFDPSVVQDPVRELDAIQRVEKKVQPQLNEVQTLLRKHQADTAYLRELCQFIENRFPLKDGLTQDAKAVLTRLAAVADDESWQSDEDRVL